MYVSLLNMTQYFKNELKKPHKGTNYFALAAYYYIVTCVLRACARFSGTGVPNFRECKNKLKFSGFPQPPQRAYSDPSRSKEKKGRTYFKKGRTYFEIQGTNFLPREMPVGKGFSAHARNAGKIYDCLTLFMVRCARVKTMPRSFRGRALCVSVLLVISSVLRRVWV